MIRENKELEWQVALVNKIDEIPTRNQCYYVAFNIICYIECDVNNSVTNDLINKSAMCVLDKKIDNNIYVYLLPINTFFYKGMTKNLAKNSDILNIYGSKPSWYGSLKNASKYATIMFNDDPGIHQYITTRQLKLFDLLNWDNLYHVVELIKSKIKMLIKKFVDNKQLKYDISSINYDIESNINSNINSNVNTNIKSDTIESAIKQIAILVKSNTLLLQQWSNIQINIHRYIKQIEAIQFATGYKMSYIDQFKYYAITNKNLDMKDSYKYFVTSSDKEIFPVTYSLDLNQKTTIGHLKQDLNRISDYKFDAIMTNALIEHYNFDGYYCLATPSLYHDFFDDEICIFCSRGSIERIFGPRYDWNENNDQIKYLEDFKNKYISIYENFKHKYPLKCDNIEFLGGKHQKVETSNYLSNPYSDFDPFLISSPILKSNSNSALKSHNMNNINNNHSKSINLPILKNLSDSSINMNYLPGDREQYYMDSLYNDYCSDIVEKAIREENKHYKYKTKYLSK